MLAPKKVSPQNTPASLSAGEKAEVKYLSSWKEIANYMGKGVRTVQRYEAKFGLPVRRPAGKSRAAVLATRADIDAWVLSSPLRAAVREAVKEALELDPELAAIRQGIQEMHELRREMQALRDKTRDSLNELRAGVQALMKSSREQRHQSHDVLESALHSSRKLVSESLPTNPGRTN